MPDVAATVIGGGIVGCAVLDALARRGVPAVPVIDVAVRRYPDRIDNPVFPMRLIAP